MTIRRRRALTRLLVLALCAVLALAPSTALAPGVAQGLVWSGMEGAGLSGVTTARTPTAGGSLAWEFVPDESAAADAPMAGFKNRSEALVVGGEVLYVVGSRLYGIDVATGSATRTCELAGSIDYTSRPVYDEEAGLILVPLHGGALEAVRADTFEEAWATEVVDEGQQSLSTPLLSGGRVYLATTDGGSPGRSGHLLCVDLATHEVVWDDASDETGYYWVGAAMCARGLLIGDDAGDLTLRDPDDGHVLASVSLGGPIRTMTVLSADGSTAYVMTRDDGTLHAVDVASMVELGSVKVCDYSTSTPTVVGNVAYVGGMSGRAGAIYAVDVGDPTDPQVTASATTLATGATTGEVKASPLVSVQDGSTYVYFTANDANGALYVWHVGETGFRLLCQPDARQWCVASPVCDAEGAIYYANDSSALFKVVAAEESAAQPGPSAETPDAQQQGSTTSQVRGGVASGGAGATRTQVFGTSASGADSADGSGATGDAASSPDAGAADAGTADESSVDGGEGAGDGVSDTGSDDASAEVGEESRDGTDDDGPSEAQVHGRSIPVWPIVGIVAGLAAIVLAVCWPRLRKVVRGKGHDSAWKGDATGGRG